MGDIVMGERKPLDPGCLSNLYGHPPSAVAPTLPDQGLVSVLVLLVLGIVDKQVTSLRELDQLSVSTDIALGICGNDDAATLKGNAEDENTRPGMVIAVENVDHDRVRRYVNVGLMDRQQLRRRAIAQQDNSVSATDVLDVALTVQLLQPYRE